MSKKILFIINTPDFFLSHRLDIALAAKKLFDVHIATCKGSKIEEIKNYGLMHHKIFLNREARNFFLELKCFFSIFKLIKKLNPDIVHLVTIRPSLYGGIISKFLKVNSIVISVSGLGSIFTKNNLKFYFYRKIIFFLYKIIFFQKKNLKIIFQNDDDKDIFLNNTNLSEDQTVMIRGVGVNLNIYKNLFISMEDNIVVMISRLLKDKGVIEYLEAASQLTKKYNNIKFWLVGDLDLGNPMSLTKNEINAWEKKNIVSFLGYSENIIKIINQSKIVVLPSYREGMPKILLEAAACERAIITTNVPGCRDAIIPDKTGLLIQPRDVYSLVVAIEKLVFDNNLCRSMGKEGRKFAENKFSINDVISSHLNVYKLLLKRFN